MAPGLMWFRRDLRLADNAALTTAVTAHDAVVPVALSRGPVPSATASEAWRQLSLRALDESLRALGNGLLVREDPAAEALKALVSECGASTVYATRDWTPQGMAEESSVRDALRGVGIELRVFEGQLLVTPDALLAREGRPYRVFTPFFRAWLGAWCVSDPLPAPGGIPGSRGATATVPRSDTPSPEHDTSAWWWTPGEASARARLDEFAAESVLNYEAARDIPSVRGTSELSPSLAHGELSPACVLHALRHHPQDAVMPFVRQLAWREFAYHVLHHFPHTATMPLREEFSHFPWHEDAEQLAAWKAGATGYPLVDAGMRQLAATGWMHNRVRLVCGSFLTKDLLVPWQSGEAHFREHLVDFEPALNAFNWQWVAGSGADAAPYFRVFNPTVQLRRFDADGAYVNTWLPEDDARNTSPIIDHAEARERALAAYGAIKRERRQ